MYNEWFSGCVGELYMIVEFCLYGNLQKFILANRLHFINQINPDTYFQPMREVGSLLTNESLSTNKNTALNYSTNEVKSYEYC